MPVRSWRTRRVFRYLRPGQKEWRRSYEKYLCLCGTCVETSYGEDAASRGRILLFEVDYVPCRRKSRSGGKGRGVGHAPRFTLTHAKKVRGAVSQCAQVMEHIIVSVANRVEVYSVEGKEMKQIATHHAPC